MTEKSKTAGKSTLKLGKVSAINFAGFIVEVLGGAYFGSLALLSDGFHMLFDSTAYFIAFISGYIAETLSDESSWSFGYHRIETMAAFANGALLIPMASLILWESYNRFLNPGEIGFIPTLSIAVLGLLINAFSVFYLQGDGVKSLNEKSAYIHLLGDSGGSVAVILSTLIVHFTGINIVDPVTAVIIASFIFWSASKVLRSSTDILLEKSPLDIEKIEEKIRQLNNVHGIKEIRVWSICSRITISSVHICDKSPSMKESEETRQKIREILSESGITHSTIEMESHDYDGCEHKIDHTY